VLPCATRRGVTVVSRAKADGSVSDHSSAPLPPWYVLSSARAGCTEEALSRPASASAQVLLRRSSDVGAPRVLSR
jgi:hypothetical protein